jgi:hypothetical protein
MVGLWLNEGLIIPVHKGKGKDPFQPGSYRPSSPNYPPSTSITASWRGRCTRLCPDSLSKGSLMRRCNSRSTADTCTWWRQTFPVSMWHWKSFDSVEIPILLKRLYSIGINGKLWRLLKHWYSTPSLVIEIVLPYSAIISAPESSCTEDG